LPFSLIKKKKAVRLIKEKPGENLDYNPHWANTDDLATNTKQSTETSRTWQLRFYGCILTCMHMHGRSMDQMNATSRRKVRRHAAPEFKPVS
jgi:hypothetical protein